MTDSGPGAISTDDLFSGKKVVLVSVPGAFTPTCSMNHLPGFVDHADDLKAKGVSIRSPAWPSMTSSSWTPGARIAASATTSMMLADGNGEYSKALGLELDASGFGMGMRGQRFAHRR